MGREAATWRLRDQESEHTPTGQAEGGRAARQTPTLAIFMVREGAEELSEAPVQGHHAPLRAGGIGRKEG